MVCEKDTDLKQINNMWIYTNKYDGFTIVGNREEIAEKLNIFEDIYDDDVWNNIVEDYGIEWVED